MYEEKYVRRGEIYSIRSAETCDAEGGMTRPGLIVSSNINNSKNNAVIVVFLTTNDNNIGIHYGPIMNTGRASYVCCERIMQVTKARLGKLMGSLSENQMKEVENRLDEVLDLGWVDNSPVKEKEQEIDALKLQLEELKAENARLKKKDEQHEDELLTRDVEIAVAKRMYEKAVGIIAAMRVEPDKPKPPEYVQQIEAEKKENPPKPKKPEPPKEPEKPDINTATFSQLRGVGFSNSQTLATINGRPYKSLEDLKNTPGITAKAYNILSPRVCCVPLPVEEESKKVIVVEEPVESEVTKVNVNTATMKELTDIGLNKRSAQEIVSHRKKNGDYAKLEDLLNLKSFGNTCMKRYGHLLEV